MKFQERYQENNLYSVCNRQRDYNSHKKRVNDIYSRSTKDRGTHFLLNQQIMNQTHIRKETSSKFFQQLETIRLQKENDLLLQKLMDISSRPISVSPKQNSPQQDSKFYHKNMKCLELRQAEIIEANERISRRLTNQQATLSNKVMEQSFYKQQQYKMRIVKYKLDQQSNQFVVKAMQFHQPYLEGQEKHKLPALQRSIKNASNVQSSSQVQPSDGSPQVSDETVRRIKGRQFENLRNRSFNRKKQEPNSLLSKSVETNQDKLQRLLNIYNTSNPQMSKKQGDTKYQQRFIKIQSQIQRDGTIAIKEEDDSSLQYNQSQGQVTQFDTPGQLMTSQITFNNDEQYRSAQDLQLKANELDQQENDSKDIKEIKNRKNSNPTPQDGQIDEQEPRNLTQDQYTGLSKQNLSQPELQE